MEPFVIDYMKPEGSVGAGTGSDKIFSDFYKEKLDPFIQKMNFENCGCNIYRGKEGILQVMDHREYGVFPNAAVLGLRVICESLEGLAKLTEAVEREFSDFSEIKRRPPRMG
jgi:hypothetical protein